MQAEEALRHDWFRELLIQAEREIDNNETPIKIQEGQQVVITT